MKTVEVALQEIKRNADNQEGSADASDESKKTAIFLLAAEVPHVMGKAVEMFIRDITTRAWMHADTNRRKTIQKPDIIHATRETETYDFLIDVIHGLTNNATDRDDTATTTDTTTDVTQNRTTTVAADRTRNIKTTTTETVTATSPTTMTSPVVHNEALWHHHTNGMMAQQQLRQQQQPQDPPPLQTAVSLPNSTEPTQNFTENGNHDSDHPLHQESYSQNYNGHSPEQRLPHIPLHHADLLLFSPTVEQTQPLPPPPTHDDDDDDDEAPLPDDLQQQDSDPTPVRAGEHSTNFDASLPPQPWTFHE